MDHQDPNHWRNLFDRGRREPLPGNDGRAPFGQPDAAPPHSHRPAPPGGYDDGHDPARPQPNGGEPTRGPLSPEEITDEAALALALDPQEYRPWVLQRGRSRPAMMLHLRRFEPKSGLWTGWVLSYPQLLAAEYTGDRLLSLDFGTRQFIIEGAGLDELAQRLQSGSVLIVQEYAAAVWQARPGKPLVTSIRCLGGSGDARNVAFEKA